MATYKEIKGVTIQTRDEDPTENVGTWASAPNLNAANREGGGQEHLLAQLTLVVILIQ